MTTSPGYNWRHGWVPLTMRAALAKAHGNHKQAAKLLGAAREHRTARREAAARSFVSPNPAHQLEHAAAVAKRPAPVMPSGGAFAERAKRAAADPGVNLRAGNIVSVRGDNAGTVTKVTGGWLSKPYPGGDAAVWKTRNEAIGALALLHGARRR